MTRVTLAATLGFLVACRTPGIGQTLELSLSHVANEQEVATSSLFASPAEIRGKAVAKGNELFALFTRDAGGRFLRYDRELKNTRDGTIISGVTVSAGDDAIRLRERGPMGSRTKSVAGPAIDVVVDATFPELLIPFLLDRSRKAVRALVLPDLEIKTIVLEDRGEHARYAAIPGGGVTLTMDASGGFARLTLPGPEPRVVVPAGSESRAAESRTWESRLVLNRDGGVRLGVTLALPPGAAGPRPAAVLLADAGLRDRNGAGGGSLTPVLRLLADELGAAGVATVRADKRGVGESVGPDPDLASLVQDARALLEVASLHPGIDRSRVYLIGHGEGAVVACELARIAPAEVAGIVTLSGPARPLPEALETKLRARLSAAGTLAEDIEGAVASLRSEIETLRQLPPAGRLGPGQALLRDLVPVDPSVQVAALRVPVLIVHGTGDRETPPSHVALMRASLAFSSDRTRFQTVDGADHDLLEMPPSAGVTGAAPAEADVARALHPGIAALIRAFVEQPAPPKRPDTR